MTYYFDTSFARNDNERRRNHGMPWEDKELDKLCGLYEDGLSLAELCHTMQRPANGIVLKLCHLRLIAFNIQAMKYEMRVPQNKSSVSQPQPQEPIMSKNTPVIQTKTFIVGIDAANQSDAQIFEILAGLEADIEGLSTLKNKPKKLLAVIEQKQKDINDLVAFVDARP